MKRDETRRVYSLIGVLGITVTALLTLVNIAAAAPYAYITNFGDNTVSVIDTATNTVKATAYVGDNPIGVAVSPDGTKAYVTNYISNSVSVIDTTTNKVTAKVRIGKYPCAVAVSPDGTKVYVTRDAYEDESVSVIDTSTNTVTATVPVGSEPYGVAVTPDGTKVYVSNTLDNTVSVIDVATNMVTVTIPIVNGPQGIAVNPAGTKVYVTNQDSDTVSVIDTATNTVTATVEVGWNPVTFGQFIGPQKSKLPVANFTSNITSCPAPLTVQFRDLSKYATSWEWNFGDRTNSTVQSPVHKYSRAGNYTVALKAINAVGNSTIAKKSYIKVTAATPKPAANFTSNRTNGSAPLTVHFTDLSKYATSWEWSFGDKTTSTEENPTHKYSRKGNYTVALRATNAVGTNTMTKKSYVKVK